MSLVIATRYPILHKQRIFHESSIYGSGIFWLKIGGDTVLVINNHFENNALTRAERGQFSDIISGQTDRDEARDETRTLFHKITNASVKRAPQVDNVAHFVEENLTHPIILCGDFNSCPNSYPVYRLSQLLTDCYATSANGPGWTYNKNRIDVRIDHIMCSQRIQPYRCKTDRKNAISDHYPVLCWLKIMPK